MKITKNEVVNNQTIYYVEAETKAWTEAVSKAEKNLTKNLSIPGFRKGHVPENIAKKHLNEFQIINEAANKFIPNLLTEFWKEYDKKPNENILEDTLRVDFDKASSHELVLKLIFDNNPEVEIKDYDKIKINYTAPNVDEKEVEFEFNNAIRNDYMLKPKKDAIIANGDMVKFDFKGFVNEEAFAGGEAKDFDLEIGSKRFIPGFEDQMIGMKLHEKCEINVAFPKDYHANELAGKEARFEVNIKEINEIIKPTIDENYLKKFNVPGLKTEKDFKEHLKKEIFKMKNYTAKREAITTITNFIADHAKISYLPTILIEKEKERISNDIINRAKTEKMDLDKYVVDVLKYASKEDYLNKITETATRNIKITLTIMHLIDVLKIEVSEEDVNYELSTMANLYKVNVEEIKKNQQLVDNINTYLLNDKLFDKLIALNAKN